MRQKGYGCVVLCFIVLTIWETLFFEQDVFAMESRSFTGATITSHNSRMKGHVIKSFIARSQIACAQACKKNARCVSINFELGSLDGGLCELNSYGASIGEVEKELEHAEGFVYSQFAEEDCQITGCLHDGSCMFDRTRQEFSCHCPLPWTGKHCQDKEALTFSFTTLNSRGKKGPTSNTGYKGLLLETVNVTNGLQEWSVPFTDWYYVEMCGASGGDGYKGKFGGKGAKVHGTVFLKKETSLIVLVGQKGKSLSIGNPGSGGGGSFVMFSSNSTPLSVAGGGGGGAMYDGGPGQANEAEGLQNGTVRQGGVGCAVGDLTATNDGGPGGGWEGKGRCLNKAPCDTQECSAGGKSFTSGGEGGCGVDCDGGFGGGGACGSNPGAGGGYSGGSVFAKYDGSDVTYLLAGGGGSFVPSSTWEWETGGCDRGDGYVTFRLTN